MEKEREKDKETGREFPVRVGISIGDINGIGPEVVIKALNDNRLLLDCTPVIYASNKVLAYHKKLIENQDFSYQSCKSADDAPPADGLVVLRAFAPRRLCVALALMPPLCGGRYMCWLPFNRVSNS